MVIKALLDGSIKGVGKFHKTSIFPCGIFQMATGVNRKPGDPNYDLFQLALKSTSIRLYPNFCNTDWSVDKANIANDRKIKQSVLDSLSKEDIAKLVEWGEKNPEDLKKLNLQIVEE